MVDELLKLCDLFFAWLAKLFHGGRKPRTRSAFVSQPGDPHTTILRHDLIGFAIVTHDRGTAVKRIALIVEPLLSEKEVTKVGNGCG